jgi:hypothetical protein
MKKFITALGLAGLLYSCSGCQSIPDPILEPLPESAVSKDGKLIWHKTSLGYIVEGTYKDTDGKEREGRFEYIAYDDKHGPYICASTKEQGIPISGYDGTGDQLLDGQVNRVDAFIPFLGKQVFTCEDGKDPSPQNGYKVDKLKELISTVNTQYHAFYDYLQGQFDPKLVRIAWESTAPWQKCNATAGTDGNSQK